MLVIMFNYLHIFAILELFNQGFGSMSAVYTEDIALLELVCKNPVITLPFSGSKQSN